MKDQKNEITIEEKRRRHREYMREYRAKNRDKINEYQRESTGNRGTGKMATGSESMHANAARSTGMRSMQRPESDIKPIRGC